MIYTVTFNPAIDYIVQIKEFIPGQINRVEADYKYPGGKGINVARVLRNLNIPVRALGFIGGFTGEYVKDFLEKEGIETDFINVKGETRINIKLKSNEETEINGIGPVIDEERLEKLFEKLTKLTSDDFLVLAGNVQRTLPRDIYSKIQQRCSSNNLKVIVDTTDEALLASLKYEPFLIKPNIHELSEIFGAEIDNIEKTIYHGKKLREMGAQNVIVSMASEGALLISKEGVYHSTVPKGKVKNSVGAGDSLIGGFLAKYSKSFNLIEAFKWGTASGSATAFSLDLCKKSDVERLVEQVTINTLF